MADSWFVYAGATVVKCCTVSLQSADNIIIITADNIDEISGKLIPAV